MWRVIFVTIILSFICGVIPQYTYNDQTYLSGDTYINVTEDGGSDFWTSISNFFSSLSVADWTIIASVLIVCGVVCIICCICGYIKYKVWKFDRDF
jgi:hypothetical protein